MSVNLTVLVNYVDADISYETLPSDYIAMDLTNDYLIWTQGDATVKDLMLAEPTSDQLNTAASKIDPDVTKTVDKCLLMDYSHDVGGAYYTHKVLGMSENKRYVYGFSFDGATASEPRLESWDDTDHDSTDLHVLGNGTPADSMVKAVCTTASLPGASWAGYALAGARVLQLNNGNGALAALGSGETSQELYCNCKIVIPSAYSTPAVENFVLTCRYTWS